MTDSISSSIKTYKTKMSALNKLISPVMMDAYFFEAINDYGQLEKIEEQKRCARYVLDTLDYDIFSQANIDFAAEEDIVTLSEALTPDPNTKKLTFDCNTSSFVYVDVLELVFGSSIPVVLLDCSNNEDGHMLVRWKFSDGSYINWETTSGKESSADDSKAYAGNCKEIVPGSRIFYSLFYSNVGDAKSDAGNYIGAIAAYDKAIELDPKGIYARYNRELAKEELRGY